MKKCNVILVDDHPLIRDGLKNVINSQSDMQVVAEAENGDTALRLIFEHKPDIVILDISLPDYNGLEIAAQIQKYSMDSKTKIDIIILTMFLKERLVFQALQSGVKGYIYKSASSSQIIFGIRAVCCGKYYLSPEVSTNIIPEYLKNRGCDQPRNLYDLLTDREQQIFRMLAEGHSNKDVAEFLKISIKTVERHRANIMSKLNLHSYRALLKYAVDLGILLE